MIFPLKNNSLSRKPFRALIYLIIMLVIVIVGSRGAMARQSKKILDVANYATDTIQAGEVLVKFKEGVRTSAVDAMMDELHASYEKTVYGLPVQVWKVPAGNELDVVERLRNSPLVEYAEPNYIVHAFVIPNDPYYSDQWGLDKIRANDAWDISKGSNSVVVAVIDTGIDETHPDLSGKIVAGKDFVDEDTNPHDGNGHGTHVAGIVAAVTNNSVGVASLGWNTRVMPLRVLNDEGSGSSSDIAAAINWGYLHGAKVLNLSLGGEGYSSTVQDAVNHAHSAGALVVAAMGNYRLRGNPTMYPAAYNNVMAVAATSRFDTYGSYSQYGSHCDIAAPGSSILSTMPTYDVVLVTEEGYKKNYDYLSGTSMATPFVSALAALVFEVNPSLSSDEVQDIIQSTAVDLGPSGWDEDYGYGRIDALAALQEAYTLDAPSIAPVENGDGDGDYLIDWNDVQGAASYVLQEDDNSAFSSPTTIYEDATSQYAVTGRGPGTRYYRVRAKSGSVNSEWSSARYVTVKPNAPVLDAIDNVDLNGEYTITWSHPIAADGFVLQEDDNASFSSPVTRYLGANTSYQVTGQDGGSWYYRVRAYNGGGNSGWSNDTRQVSVNPPPYSAPLLQPILNSDGDGNFTVAWTQVLTTTYILERSADEYFSNPEETYSTSSLQEDVTNIPSGTWYFRVRAMGSEGMSAWSNVESVVVVSDVFLPIVLNSYQNASSFDIQFVNSMEGWKSVSGNWSVQSGYLTTPGMDNYFVSVSYPQSYSDFDYQVKLKRTGCDLCASTILVRGKPKTLVEKNKWYSYYAFQYTRSGSFSVFKRVDGDLYVIKDWTTESAINTGDAWNILRVWAKGSDLRYYINGNLVWSGQDSSLKYGNVGVSMYQEPDDDNQLFVDWATLTLDVSQSGQSLLPGSYDENGQRLPVEREDAENKVSQ